MSKNPHSSVSTSPSLIRRVKARQPDAWQRLATIYTPLVYGWARRSGLKQHDAEDVVQDVFQTVFTKIDEFQKQGQQSRFRGWLWVITRNRARLFFRQADRHPQAIGGSSAGQFIEQQPDLLDQETAPISERDNAALLSRTLQLIRGDFTQQCWEAFDRVALQGQSPADVAADLKMTTSAVRQAKYRVLCRLKDELAED